MNPRRRRHNRRARRARARRAAFVQLLTNTLIFVGATYDATTESLVFEVVVQRLARLDSIPLAINVAVEEKELRR